MSRNIPGFYYDEEKKKYFKIQPNHTVPAGSAYSVDGVKKRRREEEAALLVARNLKLRDNHIRRPAILQDPLLGGSLARELGHKEFVDAALRTYTQGWDAREILQAEHIDAIPGFPIPRQHVNNTQTIAAFDFDPVTRTLLCPVQEGTLWAYAEQDREVSFSDHEEITQDKPKPIKPSFRRRYGESIMMNRGPISSVDINPTTRMMLATWQAPRAGSNVFLTRLIDTEGPLDLVSALPGPYMLAQHGDRSSTIWGATHGTPGSPLGFVIASQHGVLIVGKDNTMNYRQQIDSQEVLAVECLSHHPTVILAGTRRGLIHLIDIRLEDTKLRSRLGAIKHPGAICSIKQIDDNLVVVAGLNSTLCNYDLRYCKRQGRPKLWADSAAWSESGISMPPSIKDIYVTTPILTYPDHSNDAHLDLGFDVDAEAGIAAVVQDDENNTIKVFSLKSGEVVRTLDATEVGGSFDAASAKALRFVKDRKDGGMKSLWVAKGTKMVSYAW